MSRDSTFNSRKTNQAERVGELQVHMIGRAQARECILQFLNRIAVKLTNPSLFPSLRQFVLPPVVAVQRFGETQLGSL